MKNKGDSLKVVTDFTVESGKTKELAAALKTLAGSERTVLILKDDDAMLKRAGRNIPWLALLSFNRLRAHDLFYARRLLLLEGAAVKLNEFFADSKGGQS